MPRPLLVRIRSLYVKVVVPIIGLVLGSMVVISFFAMHAMSEGVRLVAAQRAQFVIAFTRNSVEDIEHVMLAEHGVRLQDLLERLAQNPDLDGVRILSERGKVLYSSHPEEIGKLLPNHIVNTGAAAEGDEPPGPTAVELPGFVHASAPIRNSPRCRTCHDTNSRVLGYVDVDVDLSRQAAGMRRWGQIAGVAVVVQFLAVGLGIALVLGYTVVAPVRRLVTNMGEVQHGNLNVNTEPTGTVELDMLVGGLNNMVDRLRAAAEVEEEARRAQMRRVEQLATVGEMAASLAHEIRNPLSGVKAAVEVLAREHTDEESRLVLRNAAAELGRVDGVVRQLLNYARPKAPVLAPMCLNDVVADAVALSRPRAAAKELGFQVALSPAADRVVGDAEMTRQVVVNLLLNALQAVEGRPDGRVDVTTEVQDGHAVCRVRDNGPGVPADRAESIFQPFFTTKSRGTGLGLATSRRLIELQAGRLWLVNAGEPGASFAFTLPFDGDSR